MTGADEFSQRFLDDRFQQHCRAMFIKQQKLRIDSRFNRKLAQQARAETVNGRDHRAIERAFVIEPMLSLVSGAAVCRMQVELCSQSLAHFVGGAIGESDGDDLIDVEMRIATQDVQ